jgi:hypothetical protein
MKKVLVALITVATIGSAHAWGPREQGALAGVASVLLYQHVTQPRVVYQQQPQVIYQQQTIPAPVYPEYRTMPQYSPQYQPPSVSCIPAYDQFGRYLGCIR